MLSAAKVDAILQGQTGLARKVYEATPIREAWAVGQIQAAMRNGGVNEQRVIVGCLKDMREAGLVKELGGLFQRAEVRNKAAANTTPTEKKPIMQKPAPITPKQAQPMEVLAELSDDIISLATDLSDRLKRLSARVEEVALSVELDREKNAENLAKFSQLQALLKGI